MRIGLYILMGVFGVFVIVIAIFAYFSFQLNQVKSAEQQARSQIKENQETERAFVIFSYKLKNLAQIAKNRKEKKEAINFFSNIFGSQVFITSIEFDQKNQVLIFKVQSQDIFVLKQVFTTLRSDAVKTTFPSVNPSQLTRSPDGTYEMAIAVVTEKGAQSLPEGMNTAIQPSGSPQPSTAPQPGGTP